MGTGKGARRKEKGSPPPAASTPSSVPRQPPCSRHLGRSWPYRWFSTARLSRFPAATAARDPLNGPTRQTSPSPTRPGPKRVPKRGRKGASHLKNYPCSRACPLSALGSRELPRTAWIGQDRRFGGSRGRVGELLEEASEARNQPDRHTSPFPLLRQRRPGRQPMGRSRAASALARGQPPTKGKAGGKLPTGNATGSMPTFSLSAASRSA